MQQLYQTDDIIVLPSTRGCLIGRVLTPQPLGPWWEYIATEPRVERALMRARELATAARTRAWIYDGTQYHPIQIAGSTTLIESTTEWKEGA